MFGFIKKYHSVIIPKANTTWRRNFDLADIPLPLRIFCKSSMSPIEPNPTKQARNIHMFIVPRLFQRSVLRIQTIKINIPPIVGVLFFFKWFAGVHSRGFERKLFLDAFINHFPKKNENIIAVINAVIARKLT